MPRARATRCKRNGLAPALGKPGTEEPTGTLTLDAWRRNPDAGWYDDGTGKQRWWDGSRWTEHYVDLHERYVELHTGGEPGERAGTAPAGTTTAEGASAGGTDRRWTDAARFSGEEQTFAGIVVDGRWIHFGAGEPARRRRDRDAYVSGAELLKRGRLSKPAVPRTLYGPSGQSSPRDCCPRTRRRRARATSSWRSATRSGSRRCRPDRMPRRTRFATWINNVSEHYRYR